MKIQQFTFIAVLCSGALLGQETPPRVVSAEYTHTQRTPFIRVVFSRALASVDKDKVTLTGGTDRVVEAELDTTAAPEVVVVSINGTLTEASKPEVCFSEVKYIDRNKKELVAKPGCTTVTFIGIEEVRKKRDGVLKEISNTTKTQNEKNLFASGFVTAASGSSTGGADIVLNSIDLGVPGMNNFLIIRKATQEGGDHKVFEGGLRYRHIHSFNRALLQDAAKTEAGPTLNSLISQMQSKPLSALIWDVAAKLEGQATSFDVANFVGETGASLRFRTGAFANRKGWWRGFVTPFAFEGGQNLNAGATANTTPAPQPGAGPANVDWIARYKAGAGTTLLYENWDSRLPVRRFDLEVQGVFRNMFLEEAFYNKTTKLVDRTGKGIRGYGQAEIRLYVGKSEAGRYGVRLSWHRGSLPPVFARVQSFQFGFLFESNDN